MNEMFRIHVTYHLVQTTNPPLLVESQLPQEACCSITRYLEGASGSLGCKVCVAELCGGCVGRSFEGF